MLPWMNISKLINRGVSGNPDRFCCQASLELGLARTD